MSITVFPRFSEVDVLGHVTNTALPVWFEEGRQEIFRHFSREASMRDLALILRRYEIDRQNTVFSYSRTTALGWWDPKGVLAYTSVANAGWSWGNLGYVATGAAGATGGTGATGATTGAGAGQPSRRRRSTSAAKPGRDRMEKKLAKASDRRLSRLGLLVLMKE